MSWLVALVRSRLLSSSRQSCTTMLPSAPPSSLPHRQCGKVADLERNSDGFAAENRGRMVRVRGDGFVPGDIQRALEGALKYHNLLYVCRRARQADQQQQRLIAQHLVVAAQEIHQPRNAQRRRQHCLQRFDLLVRPDAWLRLRKHVAQSSRVPGWRATRQGRCLWGRTSCRRGMLPAPSAVRSWTVW